MSESALFKELREEIAKLFRRRGLKIFEMALEGDLREEYQLTAAKYLLQATLGTKEMEGGSITVNFGSVPRPLELDETKKIAQENEEKKRLAPPKEDLGNVGNGDNVVFLPVDGAKTSSSS